MNIKPFARRTHRPHLMNKNIAESRGVEAQWALLNAAFRLLRLMHVIISDAKVNEDLIYLER